MSKKTLSPEGTNQITGVHFRALMQMKNLVRNRRPPTSYRVRVLCAQCDPSRAGGNLRLPRHRTTCSLGERRRLSLQERHVNAELRRRSHLPPAARTRQAPLFTLGKAHLFSPRDGVMEVCVLVKTRNRFQTAALRIEGWDHRWRATAFAFL